MAPGDQGVSGPGEPVAGAGSLSIADVEPVGAARSRSARKSSPTPLRRRRRVATREQRLALAVVAMSAVAGAFVDVEPSGSRVADRVLAAAFVGLVAAAASSAKRWTWFVAAGPALALARGGVAIACGAAALLVAIVSTDPVRPNPARGAAVGGLAALALLQATGPSTTGASALLVALAVAPVLVSGYRHAARRTRRRARWAVAVLAVLTVAIVGFYALAAEPARQAAERGQERLDAGVAAARSGDDIGATRELTAAAEEFADAERHLDGPLATPAVWLPILGPNARAGEVMASGAADVSRQAATTALGAQAETLTLQGGALDLQQVVGLQVPFGEVADTLAEWQPRLDAAATPWLVTPVADALDEVNATLDDVGPDLDRAALAVDVVPEMFGADGEARWLVAFVTPVEARGRTGFMGNFAELTAIDGRVDMTRFGRASELENGGTPGGERTLDAPADYLERWGRFDPAATWRNVTMSPDFPSAAQVMAQLYPQSGGQEVDGVIAVDPVGLASLLRLTGPIDVPGVGRLTADNAADFLLRDQYLSLPDNPERVDALESLSRATFDRLTSGNLPGPGAVADAMGDAVAAGHIHMWSADERQQRLIEDVGLDGALPAADSGRDYLGVVNNNAVGNKVDLFLSRSVAYDAAWDPDTGEVTATATVTLTNDAPSAGLPRYIIGSPLRDPPPPGTNRTYVSIYTPWDAAGASLDGEPVAVEAQAERGYRTYSLFVDVPPDGGTRTVTLRLTGQLSTVDRYRLEVGTQPLVTPDQFDLALDVGGSRDITVGGEATLVDGVVTASVPLAKEGTSYEVAVHS